MNGEAPLKRASHINANTIGEDTDPDSELQYLDITAVDSNGQHTPPQAMTFREAPSRARRRVLPGDTVLSTVRTYLKAIAHFEDPPDNLIASTGFATLSPVAGVDSRFLWRAVQAHDFVELVVAESEGVAYPAIAPSKLGTLRIMLPPLAEQRRIAAYLDEQTAKIDRLIELRQRQIELLAEQRASAIQQAVTKGLDPAVPMKDSGLPWLGEIPAHWEVKRIKDVAVMVKTGSTPPGGAERWFNNANGLDWYTPGDLGHLDGGHIEVRSGTAARRLSEEAVGRGIVPLYEPPCVLLVGIGASVGKVALAVAPCASNQQINAITFHDGSAAILTAYQLMAASSFTRACANNATLPIFNQTQTQNMKVVWPPSEELPLVAGALTGVAQHYCRRAQVFERHITLLTEYRSALINECVTGQRRVGEDSALPTAAGRA